MKNSLFTLLKADEKQVRKHIIKFLKAEGYDPIVTNDYIFAIGDIPVLLLAHYDTVHKKQPHYVINKNGVLTSPTTGLGADDRAGVYGVLEIIREHKCHVLFCGGEEIGGVGSMAFCADYDNLALPPFYVNYCIQLDRRGENDAVYYDGANDEFEKYVTDHGWQTEWGTFTDICNVCPYLGVAGVNLSIGYHKEHTLEESLDTAVMNANIERVKGMLDGPGFEWVEAVHNYKHSLLRGWFDDDGYFDDWYLPAKKKDARYYIWYKDDKAGVDNIAFAYGANDLEALGSFFVDHPDIRYNDIIEHGIYDDDDIHEIKKYC